MWLEGDSLAPFVVTPMAHVFRALELANVRSEDTLLDVGCGDGRVVVAAAALRGATARGVELEAHVAATAQRAVERWAVESATPPRRCWSAAARALTPLLPCLGSPGPRLGELRGRHTRGVSERSQHCVLLAAAGRTASAAPQPGTGATPRRATALPAFPATRSGGLCSGRRAPPVPLRRALHAAQRGRMIDATLCSLLMSCAADLAVWDFHHSAR